MNLLEQIRKDRKGESRIHLSCQITKLAEESLHLYANQLGCEKDEALDILLRYACITESMDIIFEDLGIKFNPSK